MASNPCCLPNEIKVTPPSSNNSFFWEFELVHNSNFYTGVEIGVPNSVPGMPEGQALLDSRFPPGQNNMQNPAITSVGDRQILNPNPEEALLFIWDTPINQIRVSSIFNSTPFYHVRLNCGRLGLSTTYVFDVNNPNNFPTPPNTVATINPNLGSNCIPVNIGSSINISGPGSPQPNCCPPTNWRLVLPPTNQGQILVDLSQTNNLLSGVELTVMDGNTANPSPVTNWLAIFQPILDVIGDRYSVGNPGTPVTWHFDTPDTQFSLPAQVVGYKFLLSLVCQGDRSPAVIIDLTNVVLSTTVEGTDTTCDPTVTTSSHQLRNDCRPAQFQIIDNRTIDIFRVTTNPITTEYTLIWYDYPSSGSVLGEVGTSFLTNQPDRKRIKLPFKLEPGLEYRVYSEANCPHDSVARDRVVQYKERPTGSNLTVSSSCCPPSTWQVNRTSNDITISWTSSQVLNQVSLTLVDNNNLQSISAWLNIFNAYLNISTSYQAGTNPNRPITWLWSGDIRQITLPLAFSDLEYELVLYCGSNLFSTVTNLNLSPGAPTLGVDVTNCDPGTNLTTGQCCPPSDWQYTVPANNQTPIIVDFTNHNPNTEALIITLLDPNASLTPQDWFNQLTPAMVTTMADSYQLGVIGRPITWLWNNIPNNLVLSPSLIGLQVEFNFRCSTGLSTAIRLDFGNAGTFSGQDNTNCLAGGLTGSCQSGDCCPLCEIIWDYPTGFYWQNRTNGVLGTSFYLVAATGFTDLDILTSLQEYQARWADPRLAWQPIGNNSDVQVWWYDNVDSWLIPNLPAGLVEVGSWCNQTPDLVECDCPSLNWRVSGGTPAVCCPPNSVSISVPNDPDLAITLGWSVVGSPQGFDLILVDPLQQGLNYWLSYFGPDINQGDRPFSRNNNDLIRPLIWHWDQAINTVTLPRIFRNLNLEFQQRCSNTSLAGIMEIPLDGSITSIVNNINCQPQTANPNYQVTINGPQPYNLQIAWLNPNSQIIATGNNLNYTLLQQAGGPSCCPEPVTGGQVEVRFLNAQAGCKPKVCTIAQPWGVNPPCPCPVDTTIPNLISVTVQNNLLSASLDSRLQNLNGHWQWYENGNLIGTSAQINLTPSNATRGGEVWYVVSTSNGLACSNIDCVYSASWVVLPPCPCPAPTSTVINVVYDSQNQELIATLPSGLSGGIWSWYENGNLIAGATSSILAFNNTRLADGWVEYLYSSTGPACSSFDCLYKGGWQVTPLCECPNLIIQVTETGGMLQTTVTSSDPSVDLNTGRWEWVDNNANILATSPNYQPSNSQRGQVFFYLDLPAQSGVCAANSCQSQYSWSFNNCDCQANVNVDWVAMVPVNNGFQVPLTIANPTGNDCGQVGNLQARLIVSGANPIPLTFTTTDLILPANSQGRNLSIEWFYDCGLKTSPVITSSLSSNWPCCAVNNLVVEIISIGTDNMTIQIEADDCNLATGVSLDYRFSSSANWQTIPISNFSTWPLTRIIDLTQPVTEVEIQVGYKCGTVSPNPSIAKTTINAVCCAITITAGNPVINVGDWTLPLTLTPTTGSNCQPYQSLDIIWTAPNGNTGQTTLSGLNPDLVLPLNLYGAGSLTIDYVSQCQGGSTSVNQNQVLTWPCCEPDNLTGTIIEERSDELDLELDWSDCSQGQNSYKFEYRWSNRPWVSVITIPGGVARPYKVTIPFSANDQNLDYRIQTVCVNGVSNMVANTSPLTRSNPCCVANLITLALDLNVNPVRITGSFEVVSGNNTNCVSPDSFDLQFDPSSQGNWQTQIGNVLTINNGNVYTFDAALTNNNWSNRKLTWRIRSECLAEGTNNVNGQTITTTGCAQPVLLTSPTASTTGLTNAGTNPTRKEIEVTATWQNSPTFQLKMFMYYKGVFEPDTAWQQASININNTPFSHKFYIPIDWSEIDLRFRTECNTGGFSDWVTFPEVDIINGCCPISRVDINNHTFNSSGLVLDYSISYNKPATICNIDQSFDIEVQVKKPGYLETQTYTNLIPNQGEGQITITDIFSATYSNNNIILPGKISFYATATNSCTGTTAIPLDLAHICCEPSIDIEFLDGLSDVDNYYFQITIPRDYCHTGTSSQNLEVEFFYHPTNSAHSNNSMTVVFDQITPTFISHTQTVVITNIAGSGQIEFGYASFCVKQSFERITVVTELGCCTPNNFNLSLVGTNINLNTFNNLNTNNIIYYNNPTSLSRNQYFVIQGDYMVCIDDPASNYNLRIFINNEPNITSNLKELTVEMPHPIQDTLPNTRVINFSSYIELAQIEEFCCEDLYWSWEHTCLSSPASNLPSTLPWQPLNFNLKCCPEKPIIANHIVTQIACQVYQVEINFDNGSPNFNVDCPMEKVFIEVGNIEDIMVDPNNNNLVDKLEIPYNKSIIIDFEFNENNVNNLSQTRSINIKFSCDSNSSLPETDARGLIIDFGVFCPKQP